MKLNLEIRKTIVEYSLKIEYSINNLILTFFLIDKDKSRAFSNKSTSFSFKQKIDLLLDIELIDKDEFLKLELLMIIRNQFLHNVDCSSYTECLGIIDNGLKKRLLKNFKIDDTISDESNYSKAYRLLYLECQKMVINKVEERKKFILSRFDTLNSLHESYNNVIEFIFNAFEEISQIIEPKKTDDFKPYEIMTKILICTSNKYKELLDISRKSKFIDNLDILSKEDILNSLIKLSNK